MEMKKIFAVLILLSVIVFSVSSCKKDDAGSIPEEDIALAQDDAFIDAVFDDLDNMVLAEVKALDDNDYQELIMKTTNTNICYAVEVNHPDTTTFPKVITIDFGEECVVTYNGMTITRSGIVTVTLTNRWWIPGAQHILTFSNFFFNGAKIEGTRTITNLGLDNRFRLTVDIVLENGKITFPDQRFITRDADHQSKYAFHLNPLNDTLWITGTAEGINILGEDYEREIIDPVVLVRCSDYQYKWTPVEGKIALTNSERGQMSISYEGDNCTDMVILEKDGNRFTYQFNYANNRN